MLYEKEVYKIIGAAIDVHKELGPRFLEAVYEEAMTIESGYRKIPFETQKELEIYYKEEKLKKKYKPDYIGYKKIVVDFKCIPKLTSKEEAQILNYLKATRLKLGLLINFGSSGKLEWKRYINTKRTFKNK